MAGPQRPVYAVALLTGIRHNELKGLRWGDLDLLSDAPSVTVRASISKNHKAAVLPLHPALVVEVAKLKPVGATAGDLVFKGLVPRAKRFNAHLEAAGVPKYMMCKAGSRISTAPHILHESASLRRVATRGHGIDAQ